MAKKKQNNGISPAGKLAILLVLFGLPLAFFLSSWGLSRLYEIAPLAIVGVLVVISTAYTAYTAGLMYKFYETPAPVLRFVPCVCELTMIDIKYHTPCYILYVIAIAFVGATQLPYSILGTFGQEFATSAPFYFLIVALFVLLIIQVIKGIGMVGCMKDIAEEWHKQTRADVGVFSKFTVLAFVPFVRVMALYAMNKPLSTMVTFMGTTQSDGDQEVGFEEEEYDDDEGEDDDE